MDREARAIAGEGGHAVRLRACVSAVLLATAWSCASPGTPPGGPPDKEPPQLLSVVPDSGGVNIAPRAVIFRFDEVVSERPAGAGRLDDMFRVSPRGRGLDVTWDRTDIWLRPNGGWRKNAVYTITMLPGMTDLRGNVLKEGKVVVFATGPSIPDTRIAGVLFDWPKGTVALNTLVEALDRRDTTIAYVAFTDSVGAFSMRHLPPGEYLVRASLASAAASSALARTFDFRRAWDSVAVTLADSIGVELLAFVHDTLGPRIGTITIRDSVTVRVLFDQPVAPGTAIVRAQFGLATRDSTPLAIDTVLRLAEFAAWEKLHADSAARRDSAVRADSLARRDTAARGGVPGARPAPRRPSPFDQARAPGDSAGDSTRRALPKPSRPSPESEFVLRLAAPLQPQSAYRLTARDVTGLLGRRRTSERAFTTPKATVKDSTKATVKDSTKATPVAPGDRPRTIPGDTIRPPR